MPFAMFVLPLLQLSAFGVVLVSAEFTVLSCHLCCSAVLAVALLPLSLLVASSTHRH